MENTDRKPPLELDPTLRDKQSACESIEKERGMSEIDRRAFLVGCLVVPLAGCGGQVGMDAAPKLTAATFPQAKFLNPSQTIVSGNLPINFVTDFPPPPR
jgi:hypothetical protein